MKYKRILIAVTTTVVLLFGILASCSGPGGPAPSNTVSNVSDGFEVIRQAADAYLSSGKAAVTIPGTDLYKVLTDGNKANDPYIMSIRRNAEDVLGHICSAIRYPWRSLFTDEYLNQLPTKDKKIVIYDYNGHNGGREAAILNMLGWDVTNLQWGFTCWMGI